MKCSYCDKEVKAAERGIVLCVICNDCVNDRNRRGSIIGIYDTKKVKKTIVYREKKVGENE